MTKRRTHKTAKGPWMRRICLTQIGTCAAWESWERRAVCGCMCATLSERELTICPVVFNQSRYVMHPNKTALPATLGEEKSDKDRGR